MVRYCAVYGCSNNSCNSVIDGKRISFHRFPSKNVSLLKTWLSKIKRDNFTPTENSRICSSHFEEDCFEYSNFSNKRCLKNDAVPTIFAYKCALKRKRTSYTFNRE